MIKEYAFPSAPGISGLSKRELFTAIALHALIGKVKKGPTDRNILNLATEATRLADAALELLSMEPMPTPAE